MRSFKLGKYVIFIKDGNIRCTCMYSSIQPDAYIKGEVICRHLKKFIKLSDQEREEIRI